MPNLLIIVSAVILMAGVLNFEKNDNKKGLIPAKTALSLLFIIAVIIQPHPLPYFYYFLLAGLIFCLAGDVLLALPQ